MIKFFRHIRQRLLSQGKTKEYLRYAISEIILVVIGILIALAINSKYQANQNEKRISAILKQLQQELITDIKDAQRIRNAYIYRDSLAQKILNNELSKENYKTFDFSFLNAYVSFSTNKTSYNRLTANIENIPRKFVPLLSNLNLMYVEYQGDIDDYNDRIKTIAQSNLDMLLKTEPHVADWWLGRDEAARVENLYNDPYLKNRTGLYLNALGNISSSANDYRIEAIILYKKIDSLLDVKERELAVYLQETSPDLANLKTYVGYYAMGSVTAEFTMTNNHPFLEIDGDNRKLLWDKENTYYVKNGQAIIRLSENDQQQKTINLKWPFDHMHLVKID